MKRQLHHQHLLSAAAAAAVAAATHVWSAPAIAAISASWQSISISAAAIANDPALANMQTWSLQVTCTAGDWKNAGLRLTLPSGQNFYQNIVGQNTRPNPALLGAFAAVAYDTYVSSPGDTGSANGQPPAINGGFPSNPVSFGGSGDSIPGTFSVSWADQLVSSPTTFEAARLTFASSISLPSISQDITSYTREDPNTFVNIPKIGTNNPPPPVRQWLVDADGSWQDPTNWTPTGIPLNGEAIVLDVGGSSVRTITYGTGSVALNQIQSHVNLLITGGTLRAQAISFSEGALTISNGTLSSAISGAPLSVIGSNAVLDNVNASGGLNVADGVSARFTNGLQFTGQASLGVNAQLRSLTTQSLKGAGTVLLGSGASIAIDGGTTLTLSTSDFKVRGANFTIARTPGTIGDVALVSNAPLIVSSGGTGTISVEHLTGTLFSEAGSQLLVSTQDASTGTISADSNSQISINAPGGLIGSNVLAASGAVINVSGPTSLNFVVNFLFGDGNIRFDGPLELGGFQNLKIGSGTVRVNGALTLTGPLNIADSGAFVLDYASVSPLQTVRSQIIQGRITASGSSEFGIGYAEASALFQTFPATFAGESIDDTTLLFRRTRFGDANIDGVVNLIDFNALAANFNGTSKLWSQGDFTYDGIVNLDDFNRLAANFNLAALTNNPTPQDWANLDTAIPEPSAITALLVGVPASAGMIKRRRSRLPR